MHLELWAIQLAVHCRVVPQKEPKYVSVDKWGIVLISSIPSQDKCFNIVILYIYQCAWGPTFLKSSHI